MEIEISVENGRLVGYSSDSGVSVERVEISDDERYEEIAQTLVTRLLEEHPDTQRASVEIDNHDERAASLLARWGFVPVRRVLGVDVDVLRRALERGPLGESFGSVHVQTDDLPAVQRAVAAFTPLRAGGSQGSMVVPPRGGWISVYDDLADRDPTALRRLARELSDRLGAVVLALGVEEGAVVRYLLLDRGRLLDEYLSIQEYYGPLPSGEVVALAANPTLVERMTGGDRREVRAAAVHGKRPEDVPAPAETAAALARAMRIEGAEYGYRDAAALGDAIAIPHA
jgi:hypothetical protein